MDIILKLQYQLMGRYDYTIVRTAGEFMIVMRITQP